MRPPFACMLIIAGLTGGAHTPVAHTPAAHTRAQRAPAPPAAGLAPRPIGVPAGAHIRPSFAPKVSASPAPLAARPRPGNNAPTTLGGPAKYDAKKGALLGGTVMPHRP